MTSAERRDPAATSAGDEQEAERRAVVPAPRKRAASADAVGEREEKRTWSPCPLVESLVPSPPTADAAEQGKRFEERAGTRASSGSVPTRDSQPEDTPPTAPVGESRAEGHGDPQAGQEPVGTTPPPAEVRGCGLQPGSGPCPAGPSTSGLAFRVVPLTSRYVFFVSFLSFAIEPFLECDLPAAFVSGREMSGLSIAPTPMQEVWRPTLQRVTTSDGGIGWWR